jgi:hypothetical protein
MKIQLINGQFTKADALQLITKMIDVKIKFQEDKIKSDSNEEEVKNRERKIKFLQKELYEARNYIENQSEIHLESEIFLNQN